MKITFRTDYDGSIHSTNDSVIADYSISEDGLETGRDIAKHQHQSVFKLLSHKALFIALPADKLNDTGYSVVSVFAVRTKYGIAMWSVKFGYITPENKDVIFTTEDEAMAYAKKYNEYDKMVARKAELMKELESLNKSINTLGSELGK